MKSLIKILMAAVCIAAGVQTFAAPETSNIHIADIQDRHLSGFKAVNVAGSFDVYITQGNNESVKVEADEDEINRIVTEVKSGVLKISTKKSDMSNWGWGNNKKRVIYITVRELNDINLTGSGDVFFKDGIRANTLALHITGSGDISGRVDVKNLQSSITGSGDIKISGRAETSTVSVSGSGDFTGRDLFTNHTAVKVVGSGDAAVNADQQIDASVSGSGDIRYSGGAKQVSTSKSGSGSISRL